MIDWDRVNELKAEVGEEDFAEVVALFFEEIEESVARLPDVKDAEPLAHALHFLRSVSLNHSNQSVMASNSPRSRRLSNITATLGQTKMIKIATTLVPITARKVG